MMSAEHDVETREQSFDEQKQQQQQQQCEIEDDVGGGVTSTDRSVPLSSEDSATSSLAKPSATAASIDLTKRYSRHALISLRKEQSSLQHPQCSLKPELQILQVWTCRLRNDLQYLGLWKAPNTGNQYGNCTGGPGCCSNDGTCDNHGDDAAYDLNSSRGDDGSIGGGYPGGPHKPSHIGPTSLLANKRTVRPRFIHATTTAPLGGSGGNIGGYIDHRSISSSHLMPAFVKRRSGNMPGKPSEIGGPPNLRSGSANSSGYAGPNDNDSSDGNEDHKGFDQSPLGPSLKYRWAGGFKTSPNNRPSNKDEPSYIEGSQQSGWMSKSNTEYSPSGGSKGVGGSGPGGGGGSNSGANKRPVYERRIGSGRLMPREDGWGEMRAGDGVKRGEKDKLTTASQGKYNDNGIVADKSNMRNAPTRFPDARNQDRPHYERHVVDSTDNDIIVLNKYDSNNSSAAGQRSLSFRRREFMGGSNGRDSRDFKDYRGTGMQRERRDPREYNRYSKDEPEWLSEGPTSQHDTIELRGFEEMDMVAETVADGGGDKHMSPMANNKRKDSESSLFNRSSSNLNLNSSSTKEKPDGSSHEIVKIKPDNNTNTYDIRKETADIDSHDANCNENSKDIAPIELNKTMEKQAEEVVAAADAAASVATANDAVNITEQFFESFLNIDTLESSLIGGHQPSLSYNDSGSSRFSRWFSNSNDTSSSNNNDIQPEVSPPPPLREEKKPPPHADLNENQNDVNSLMAFFRSNNVVPAPELPKCFPSNVAALSVEELESRMRKMDPSEGRTSGIDGFMMAGGHNNDGGHMRNSEIADNASQTHEMNMGAFRKLLDQLGKPPQKVDMPMNILLPPGGEQSMPIPTPIGMLPPGMIPHGLPHPTPPPPLNMMDHEEILKMMHQQQMMRRHHQNLLKMIPPPQHHRMPPQQPSPQQFQVQGGGGAGKNMSHHPHLMSPIMGNPMQQQQQQEQQPPQQPSINDMIHAMQPNRPVNSPTPLAFTPTSVLRKMTAEKDNSNQQTPMPMASPLQQQQQQQQQQLPGHPIQTPPPLKQHMIQISQQQQQQQQQQHLSQHVNPPRMILGAGNLQHLQQQHPPQPQQMPPQSDGSPQMLPPHLRNQQPLAALKWPPGFMGAASHPSLVNSMNKPPMGRPILKGPVSQVMQHPQNSLKQMANHLNETQNHHNPQQVGHLQQFSQQQQQQQQQQAPPMLGGGHPFPAHFLQNQSPQNSHQHHLFQQQRSLEMQRQQMFQQHPFMDMATAGPLQPHHQAAQQQSANNDNNSATNLNYQADGRLSPTSNVLAQWFSPEVLAKASAGKLPLLNMNQALSLEALEKSIQHSSTPVHN